MNKIKILNKEFEVGDMVEIEQKYPMNKYIGYLTGEHTNISIVANDSTNRGTRKISENFITIDTYNWHTHNNRKIYKSNIKSIKKLVYER